MNNHDIAEHFNRIAPDYDGYKKKNSRYYHSLKKAVFSFIRMRNPSILDIGCGTGDILFYLKPRKGLGIDLSSQMIRIAKKKYRSIRSLKFKVHDIEKNPVKGSFDFILFNDVIEHVKNKNTAMDNISKSMKKDSTLILSMANPLWEPMLMAMEKLKLKMPEGPHYRITENELKALLHNNSLKIQSKKVFFPELPLPVLSSLGIIFIYQIKRVQ